MKKLTQIITDNVYDAVLRKRHSLHYDAMKTAEDDLLYYNRAAHFIKNAL
jgi:hypothetical protein